MEETYVNEGPLSAEARNDQTHRRFGHHTLAMGKSGALPKKNPAWPQRIGVVRVGIRRMDGSKSPGKR